MKTVLSWLSALMIVAAAGCADGGGGGSAAGAVTFGADEGVDFGSGQVKSPGNYVNSDLFATANGALLRLSTGGSSPTKSRPVNWFKPGGVPWTFESLDEVPDETPGEAMGLPLLNGAPGNGFVALSMDGAWVKGWIEAIDGSSVTLHFAPMAEPSNP